MVEDRQGSSASIVAPISPWGGPPGVHNRRTPCPHSLVRYTCPRGALSTRLRSLAAPSLMSSQRRTPSTTTRGTPQMPSVRTSSPLVSGYARGVGRRDRRHPDHPCLQGWYHASHLRLPDKLWSDELFFFWPQFVEDDGCCLRGRLSRTDFATEQYIIINY